MMRAFSGFMLCALMLATGIARSATADTGQSPGTPAPGTSGTLEEIVVTAQKRSENSQSVPIAITAISEAAIARSGINTTKDLAFFVPTLVYTQTGAYAQPYLRGIGSELTLPNADPSVTTYVDGVVVSTTFGIIQGLLGVDRIEVLEGPQGTLYGRNATAGAINVYTQTPTQTPDAQMTLSYGNFAQKQLSTSISGGIAPELAAGLYFGYTDRSTYVKQIGTATEPDSERGSGIRLKAVFTPTDNVKLTGSVEYTNERSLESGAFRNVESPDLASSLGIPNAVQPRYSINTGPAGAGGLTGVWNRDLAGTVREEVDLGWAKILGISGYRRATSTQGNDLDGSPIGILEATSTPGISKQESQEIQLLSPEQSYVTWITGLYYLHELAGLFPVGILSNVIFPPPVTGSFDNTGVALNSYAGFAQATIPLYDWLPRTRLTLGARYTHDEKTWTVQGYATEGLNVLIPGTQVNYPTEKHSWNNFSPKVTIDYHFTDDTMVYATYTKGYKAGAYNISSPALNQPPPVSPEELIDYEAGFKSEAFNHRVRLNGAGYYYDYSNIQTSVIEGGSNGVTSLQNAAAAKMYGLEATLAVAATDNLLIHASGAWEHTRYSSFQNAASFALGPFSNSSEVFNVTGNETPRAPKWVGGLGADYHYDLANNSSVHLSANALYNGGFFWEATNRFRQPAYALVNLNAGYTFPGGHFTASVFANNVTNTFYNTAFQILPTAIGVMDGPPRMYGITVNWKF